MHIILQKNHFVNEISVSFLFLLNIYAYGRNFYFIDFARRIFVKMTDFTATKPKKALLLLTILGKCVIVVL